MAADPTARALAELPDLGEVRMVRNNAPAVETGAARYRISVILKNGQRFTVDRVLLRDAKTRVDEPALVLGEMLRMFAQQRDEILARRPKR